MGSAASTIDNAWPSFLQYIVPPRRSGSQPFFNNMAVLSFGGKKPNHPSPCDNGSAINTIKCYRRPSFWEPLPFALFLSFETGIYIKALWAVFGNLVGLVMIQLKRHPCHSRLGSADSKAIRAVKAQRRQGNVVCHCNQATPLCVDARS